MNPECGQPENISDTEQFASRSRVSLKNQSEEMNTEKFVSRTMVSLKNSSEEKEIKLKMNPECGPAEQGTKTPSEESDTEEKKKSKVKSTSDPRVWPS